jgi:hypothetical protein
MATVPTASQTLWRNAPPKLRVAKGHPIGVDVERDFVGERIPPERGADGCGEREEGPREVSHVTAARTEGRRTRGF